jgi:RNA polymerase sigma factor (sigma-70 family)
VSPGSRDSEVYQVVQDSDAETYEKHAHELMRFATFLVGPSDAPDIVSAAVLRVISSRAWPQVENRRAYLMRAVANEARRHHRVSLGRLRREHATARRSHVDPPDPQPEIQAAVRTLSFRQRAVVYLTYWDDLTPPTVAETLGISEGTVRRHLARARERLRSVLGG